MKKDHSNIEFFNRIGQEQTFNRYDEHQFTGLPILA